MVADMMNCPMHSGYYSGWAVQLVILVLFVFLLWWLLKNSGSFGFRCRDNESALDILKRRLAKGEISHSEFNRLKKEIGNGG